MVLIFLSRSVPGLLEFQIYGPDYPLNPTASVCVICRLAWTALRNEKTAYYSKQECERALRAGPKFLGRQWMDGICLAWSICNFSVHASQTSSS
jgi:hypothetical protein